MASSKRILYAGRSAARNQISETLSSQQEGEGVYEDIPLDRIILDPENPRHLELDPKDPKYVKTDDPNRESKLAEITELESMSVSIQSEGVLTPIRVYRYGKDFRIAHGERRYLASIIAGKRTIPCIVLNNRPANLRLQQLIENFQRKDLSLHHRLENIQSVIDEAEHLGSNISTPADLRTITGLSRPQSSRYITLLHATKDVREAIEKGQLQQIQAAVEISQIHDPVLRAQAIRDGGVTKGRAVAPTTLATKPVKPGRPAVVKIGSIKHTDVARRIIEAVAGKDHYTVDWTDPKAVSKVFKKLIRSLEAGEL